MVQTRSQIEQQNSLIKEFESSIQTMDISKQMRQSSEFELTFDFDSASRAWKMNKKSAGNGTYYYICGATRKDGKPCQNPTHCRIHNKCKITKNTDGLTGLY